MQHPAGRTAHPAGDGCHVFVGSAKEPLPLRPFEVGQAQPRLRLLVANLLALLGLRLGVQNHTAFPGFW